LLLWECFAFLIP